MAESPSKLETTMERRMADLELLVRTQGETITALAETAKGLMEALEIVAELARPAPVGMSVGQIMGRGDRP